MSGPGRPVASGGRRLRVDQELCNQGFFETPDQAARAVLAGEVSGDGFRYEKPGTPVRSGAYLHVKGRRPFVSRGGLKLAQALRAFSVDPEGLRCLDVGCSTGGFTDVLLRAGAASVTAVDVGYGQFDWGLRQDPRVDLRERTNICDVEGPSLDGAFDLAVCDVSFTSVGAVLPAVSRLLGSTGTFVTLVKPQFEAPAAQVGAGGVVRDPQVRGEAVAQVAALLEAAGFGVRGPVESPITGAKGNHEYLLCATRGASCQPLDWRACPSLAPAP